MIKFSGENKSKQLSLPKDITPTMETQHQDVMAVLADVQKIREDITQLQSEGRSQHRMILQEVESRPIRTDVHSLVREEIERHMGDLDKMVGSTIAKVFPSEFQSMKEMGIAGSLEALDARLAQAVAELPGICSRLETLDARVAQAEASIEIFADDEALRRRCDSFLSDTKMQALDEFNRELKPLRRKIEALDQNLELMDKKHELLAEHTMGGIQEVLSMMDKIPDKVKVSTTSLSSVEMLAHSSWSPSVPSDMGVNAIAEEPTIRELGQDEFGKSTKPSQRSARENMGRNVMGTSSVSGSIKSASPSRAFPLRQSLQVSAQPLAQTQKHRVESDVNRDVIGRGPNRQQSPTRTSSPSRSPAPPPRETKMAPSAGSFLMRAPSASPERSPVLVCRPAPSPPHRSRNVVADGPGRILTSEGSRPSIPLRQAGQRSSTPDASSVARQTVQRSLPEPWSTPSTLVHSSSVGHLHSTSSTTLHGSKQHASLAQGWSALRQGSVPVVR